MRNGPLHMRNAYEEWTMRNGPLQHSNTDHLGEDGESCVSSSVFESYTFVNTESTRYRNHSIGELSSFNFFKETVNVPRNSFSF